MLYRFFYFLVFLLSSHLLYSQNNVYTNNFYLWYNTYSNAVFTAENPKIEKNFSILQLKIDELFGTGTIVVKNVTKNTIVTHELNGKLKELFDKNTNSIARVYAAKLNAYGLSQLETVTLIYSSQTNELESMVLTSLEHQSKGNFIGLKPIEENLNSTGSGFVVSNNGFIITNYHVVENAKKIFVTQNTKKIEAILFDYDKRNDIALLKVNDYFEIVYSFSTKNTEIGTDVFVLGYPMIDILGKEIKVTDGIISSNSGFENDKRYFQISAPIQPGNSGGPLFDKKGNYIGLITSKVTIGENIGYALKTNYLIDFLKRNKISIPNSKQVNISESISQKIEILKKNVISIESIRSF